MKVVLRKKFDDELLKEERAELRYSGVPLRATNAGYRKKGSETWIKIGETYDREKWFSVLATPRR